MPREARYEGYSDERDVTHAIWRRPGTPSTHGTDGVVIDAHGSWGRSDTKVAEEVPHGFVQGLFTLSLLECKLPGVVSTGSMFLVLVPQSAMVRLGAANGTAYAVQT